MYNNQADAFITTAKTIKKVAEKSKSENAVHTINALTFGTHVYQQREELIANSNEKQRTDGITITTDLGSGKEYTSCIKIFEDGRHLVYMELNKALAEEVGAACYQMNIFTQMHEGDQECNKIKAYDERSNEISAQKFNIQNGQMTEVSPTKTQGRAQ